MTERYARALHVWRFIFRASSRIFFTGLCMCSVVTHFWDVNTKALVRRQWEVHQIQGFWKKCFLHASLQAEG